MGEAFSEKRIRISLLAAVGDSVLDIYHAGEGTGDLVHEFRVCTVSDDLHELDPQEGDLRLETFDVLGLPEGLPLFRCQGFGVEAVCAGVTVAGLAASFASGCFFLGWVMGVHGYEDSERRRDGEGEGGVGERVVTKVY